MELLYIAYLVIVVILLIIGYMCGNSDLKSLLEKYSSEEAVQPRETSPLDVYAPKTSFKFQSKGELLCKRALERYYGKEFKNVRPAWLVNPATGHRLELDCYNEELRIALEYNGIQHYKYPNGISKSRAEFEKQLDRDRYKKRVCEARGIKFWTVPYTVKYEQIENYIRKIISEST